MAAAVLACGCLAAEVAVLRAGGPAVPAALALLACAAVLNLVGRTGGPLCRPDALVQGHAAWHVLTAAALWAWGTASARGSHPRLSGPTRHRGAGLHPGGRDGQPRDVDPGLEDGALPEGISCVAGGGNEQVVPPAPPKHTLVTKVAGTSRTQSREPSWR